MVVVWVCGGILEFTASLRGRGQGCSVPALPCHLREDEDKRISMVVGMILVVMMIIVLMSVVKTTSIVEPNFCQVFGCILVFLSLCVFEDGQALCFKVFQYMMYTQRFVCFKYG